MSEKSRMLRLAPAKIPDTEMGLTPYVTSNRNGGIRKGIFAFPRPMNMPARGKFTKAIGRKEIIPRARR
jgi:hypothetical protein